MPAKSQKNLGGRPKGGRSERLRVRSLAIGVSTGTLQHWENNGCDIEDDESVKAHVAQLTRVPKTINAEYLTPTEQLEETPDIAYLKTALLRTLDEKEARRIKTQIDGLLSAQKLEVLNGSYISIHEEKDAYTKLGAILKTCINRLSADLPPVLEGLDPSAMSKKITQVGDKMLSELSEGKGGMWDE